MIESSAQHHNGHYYRVHCISIPINSCTRCQTEARSIYKEKSGYGKFDLIYLQDRAADVYRCLDVKTDNEMVL
ncbi:hypothetical protein [Syntrophomonas palmitatica]|uniref:hypothetical protein n=1 Tax=Syntrophomonas palmitatica TaxID=402877 RepID=UPI000A61175A